MGNHTITASVVDNAIQPDSDSVTITVVNSSATVIDFDSQNLVTYSNQGGSGTVTSEDSGSTLHIDGNNWVRTEDTYTVTADTVIEFDFMSSVEGEIHGIGFDEDNTLTNGQRIFQVFGSQTWSGAIQVDPQYTSGDLGTWVHYSILIGQYYTGSNMHLVFVNDHDAPSADGNSWFRNVTISDDSTDQPPSVSITGQVKQTGCTIE